MKNWSENLEYTELFKCLMDDLNRIHETDELPDDGVGAMISVAEEIQRRFEHLAHE